eukprot:scaffold12654_cov113-Isochrysis_galbana.AAC.3
MVDHSWLAPRVCHGEHGEKQSREAGHASRDVVWIQYGRQSVGSFGCLELARERVRVFLEGRFARSQSNFRQNARSQPQPDAACSAVQKRLTLASPRPPRKRCRGRTRRAGSESACQQVRPLEAALREARTGSDWA